MPADTTSFAPAVMPSSSAPTTDGELLRGVTVQLRSLAESQSRDAAELGTRLARVEDDLEAGRGRSRSLAGLAAVTAAIAFLATSLVWQLGHRTAAIDRSMQEITALVSRSSATAEAAFTRIDGRLSEQSAKVDRIAAAVATVQAAGERAAVALEGLGIDAEVQVEVTGRISRQLTDAALEVAGLRSDVYDRFTQEHELAVAERAEMLRSVTAAISRVEREMLDQATELRLQREQLDVSARRLTDARRQMLAEATAAVGAQLDGLRQILDGLRSETATTVPAAVGAAAIPATPAEPVTAAAQLGADFTASEADVAVEQVVGEEPTPEASEPAAEVPVTSAAETAPPSDTPVVAARPEDTLVE